MLSKTPRFPGHWSDPNITASVSKIPTVIYYDKVGDPCAFGEETKHKDITKMAKKCRWTKVEWFKLYLRPKSAPGADVTPNLPPLPRGKKVVDVLADFLGYLKACAAAFIQSAHGNDLWESIAGKEDEKADSIIYILAHPNGWEGAQQATMREAAVKAGLIRDEKEDRLSFVTEGEASLHYAVQQGLVDMNTLKKGDGVAIIDAGGGTIDISSYTKAAMIKKDQGTFEENSPPQCYFHGSVFVTIHARIFLEGYLRNSGYFEDLDKIMHIFDTTTKPMFRNPNQTQYLKFGTVRDNDPGVRIWFGQLRLSGSDVAMFFKPSVHCITNAILEQKKSSQKPITHVVLVGGFAASDWLFEQVKESLAHLKLNVTRPQTSTNKAVADGAVSFYLDHFVRSRKTRYDFGIVGGVRYDKNKREHRKHIKEVGEDALYISPSGDQMLPGNFGRMLAKNVLVEETQELQWSCFEVAEGETAEFKLDTPFWCYKGTMENLEWRNKDEDNFSPLCDILADLSPIPPEVGTNPSGNKYCIARFTLVLYFGLTELKAEIEWTDKENNNEKKRFPAKIQYPAQVPVELSEME
ncbi:hypothetical protein NLJ89_g8379 [Agrocybe chaxingu]|uniref:Uncharacterized protein n=1 Tax=Agrocybe chaxingu TaxID=84603 RepID=A0A9W8MST5_9AGAR|nr:hypothetical protein NLJ89_g8379 [Agrocybe chaxingu]